MSEHRVSVVGDGTLAEAVESAGGDAVPAGDTVPDGDTLEEVEYVVAAGEAAVVDLAREGVDVPVLPVDAGDGVGSVPRTALGPALEQLFGGEYGTIRHPVVAVTTPFDEVYALFDVALMTAEPARISEYSVSYGDDRVGRFRADGVVGSTPAGSVGYNRAADGPLVAPGAGVLAVVPIAPFATNADHWVLPLSGVAMAVERDETPVDLLADGRTELSVAAGDPVRISRDDVIETVVVPESEGFLLRDSRSATHD